MSLSIYNLRFTNRGRKFRAHVTFLPSGDATIHTCDAEDLSEKGKWVLHAEFERAIVSPNRTRGKAGSSTHSVYNDVYDLLRGRLHTENGYGVRSPGSAGEIDEVQLTRAEMIQLADLTLATRSASPDELQRIRELRDALGTNLAKKRDPNKTLAFAHIDRTGKLDTLGRANSSRDAMLTFAGAHAMAKREKNIGDITVSVSAKALRVYEVINQQVELIRRVKEFLSRQITTDNAYAGYLSAEQGMRGENAFRAQANRARLAIEAVVSVSPYGGTHEVLKNVFSVISRCHRERMREQILRGLVECEIARLRHELEMDVLTPLSMRIAQESRRLQRASITTTVPSLADEEIRALVQKTREMIGNSPYVDGHDTSDLDLLFEESFKAIDQRDWRVVKHNLKKLIKRVA